GEVVLPGSPPVGPRLGEVVGRLGRRGCYAIVRMDWSLFPVNWVWAAEAREELVGQIPEVDLYASDRMDARMSIDAPENTREGGDLSPERHTLVKQYRKPFFRRTMGDEIPWVGCQYPPEALAQ